MSDPAWTNIPIRTAATESMRKNSTDVHWDAVSESTADPNNCTLTMADLIDSSSAKVEKENMESKSAILSEPDRVCVVLNGHGKLGSVYSQVSRILARQGGWKRKKNTNGRFHMVFGEAGGVGIPFKRFSQVFRYDYGIKPLVNYNRNCKTITDKAMLTQTLLKHFAETEYLDCDKFLPETYLFWPGRNEVSQRKKFESAFNRNIGLNVWIIKPCSESHGNGIFLSSNFDEIIDHMNNQPEGSKPWLVQRYVENPMLLRSRRKFDIRVWVLLTHDYKVYIHREGVMRTSSVGFSMSDLKNKFIHMTNHSIQEEHEDFGKHEEGNEIFFESFDHSDLLEVDITLDEIMSQVKEAVRETFMAAKPVLERIDEIDDYHSFMFFGFDFMLDVNKKVWLLEVNASPAVAKPLLRRVASDIIETAIDPLFPRPKLHSNSKKNGFELIFESKGNCGFVANMPAPQTMDEVEIEAFGQIDSSTMKK